MFAMTIQSGNGGFWHSFRSGCCCCCRRKGINRLKVENCIHALFGEQVTGGRRRGRTTWSYERGGRKSKFNFFRSTIQVVAAASRGGGGGDQSCLLMSPNCVQFSGQKNARQFGLNEEREKWGEDDDGGNDVCKCHFTTNFT